MNLFALGIVLGLVERLPAQTPAIGVNGSLGARANAQRVTQLKINKPGVYENYLIDGDWIESNLVKIQADEVTLRHCEIRHGQHNGVVVYASNTVIDSCRIHHLLKGNFAEQADAHGISGCPKNLTIRNCEIYLVSGDAVQFDPGRGAWGDVLIEQCTFWTGPLEAKAARFLQGERPGENAVDTKASPEHPRARITIRNSLFYGWGDGQITNQAALNLKEHVHAAIENCVFRDNDICLRLRGDNGKGRGAEVEIRDCALYASDLGLRMEDRLTGLLVERIRMAPDIKQKYHFAGPRGTGFHDRDERAAPPYPLAVQNGLIQKD